MLFNSLAYLIFLPVVIGIFWLLPFRFRSLLLMLASYVFYMYWKPQYGLLLFLMTVTNYWFGLWIGRLRAEKNATARGLLWAAVLLDVALLGYFKYFSFTIDCINSAFHIVGVAHPLNQVSILLPLGISFFTFEFLHYVVDVYKGSAPVESFIDFAVFASFFPTQIAGPIKRYQDFCPQLKQPGKMSLPRFNEAVELILFGLFKKVILADTLAVVVDRCYAHVGLLNGADCWLLAWAFTFQIYFDFSGYSDIARGSALLLGFDVPINFKLPLIAGSISDLWNRWHITLSSWLREYVYFPLGGSRVALLWTLRNLIITMAVSGLWHGASAHFVMFGLFNGLLLVVNQLWIKLRKRVAVLQQFSETRLFSWLAVALTFNGFTLGFVFFRAPSNEIALNVIGKMFGAQCLQTLPGILSTSGELAFAILPFMLLALAIGQFASLKLMPTPGILNVPERLSWFKPVYLGGLILLLIVLSPDVAPSFVYFQF